MWFLLGTVVAGGSALLPDPAGWPTWGTPALWFFSGVNAANFINWLAERRS